ncbi:MAG: RNA polymerase subunit sigma-24 [Bacteroidetes bacterium HGW-Bacteroidetes-12]|nr:MAG: RNA polymerase subunit sigma-24 [Bacteroidetes bacterium HGW-Bacteroidetes-12]
MVKIIPLYDSEKILLEQLMRQNRTAQRQLFDTYHKKLLSICFRYLKNEDDALDTLNRSFLKIFEKIHQYKAEAKLEFWLKRITINTCLDTIKSDKNYKHNFILTHEFSIYGEPNDENNALDDWWEAALSIPSEILFKQIENLPPATCTVFNLYAIDGFTHVQIANQLKISVGTSKWHLNNARTLLKEKIIHIIQNKKFNNGTKEAENH